MPIQAHKRTAWLIQYSYAVDYYFMIYTAHFFALILPRKVQYIVMMIPYTSIDHVGMYHAVQNSCTVLSRKLYGFSLPYTEVLGACSH